MPAPARRQSAPPPATAITSAATLDRSSAHLRGSATVRPNRTAAHERHALFNSGGLAMKLLFTLALAAVMLGGCVVVPLGYYGHRGDGYRAYRGDGYRSDGYRRDG